MKQLKCQRCGNLWIYNGKAIFYTSCSRCKTSVNLRRFEDVEVMVKVIRPKKPT